MTDLIQDDGFYITYRSRHDRIVRVWDRKTKCWFRPRSEAPCEILVEPYATMQGAARVMDRLAYSNVKLVAFRGSELRKIQTGERYYGFA